VGRSSHRNERSQIEDEYFFCCQKENARIQVETTTTKGSRDERTVNDRSSSVNQKLAVTFFFWGQNLQICGNNKKEILQRVWR
jgi:hypothetical protein